MPVSFERWLRNSRMRPALMSNEELQLAIDKYLQAASTSLAKWGDWLAEHERRVLAANVQALIEHAIAAEELHEDLRQLSQRREHVLAQATQLGFACSSLKQLAQALPQWHVDAAFRLRIRNVERSMNRLRRLNTAAWMLVKQCSRVVDDTLLLMTSGSTMHGAYIDTPHADTSGGQLLDTQI